MEKAFWKKVTKTKTGWFKIDTKTEYVPVIILGYGTRHTGRYNQHQWDYVDVLIKFDGKTFEIDSRDLFTETFENKTKQVELF